MLINTLIGSVVNVLAIVGWLAGGHGLAHWERNSRVPWYGWFMVLPGLFSFPFRPTCS
jgi:hypothetical protein